MDATVIDTLRFANRLKEAGVDARQAEAMSRAFNDELSEGVATKRDLDNAVTELKGEMAQGFSEVDARLEAMDAKFLAVHARFEAMEAKFDVRFEAMDTRFEALEAKFDARFETMDTRFKAVDTRFEAMNTRFEALAGKVGTLGRYTFVVLALIAALGLYIAAAPHIIGKPSATAGAATPAPSS